MEDGRAPATEAGQQKDSVVTNNRAGLKLADADPHLAKGAITWYGLAVQLVSPPRIVAEVVGAEWDVGNLRRQAAAGLKRRIRDGDLAKQAPSDKSKRSRMMTRHKLLQRGAD